MRGLPTWRCSLEYGYYRLDIVIRFAIPTILLLTRSLSRLAFSFNPMKTFNTTRYTLWIHIHHFAMISTFSRLRIPFTRRSRSVYRC